MWQLKLLAFAGVASIRATSAAADFRYPATRLILELDSIALLHRQAQILAADISRSMDSARARIVACAAAQGMLRWEASDRKA
jgi:hypothetical protein